MFTFPFDFAQSRAPKHRQEQMFNVDSSKPNRQQNQLTFFLCRRCCLELCPIYQRINILEKSDFYNENRKRCRNNNDYMERTLSRSRKKPRNTNVNCLRWIMSNSLHIPYFLIYHLYIISLHRGNGPWKRDVCAYAKIHAAAQRIK